MLGKLFSVLSCVLQGFISLPSPAQHIGAHLIINIEVPLNPLKALRIFFAADGFNLCLYLHLLLKGSCER